MTIVEQIGYFFVWIANFAVSLVRSVLSLFGWFSPVVDFFRNTFEFLPGWVFALLVACIAIEIVIFILNLGGE